MLQLNVWLLNLLFILLRFLLFSFLFVLLLLVRLSRFFFLLLLPLFLLLFSIPNSFSCSTSSYYYYPSSFLLLLLLFSSKAWSSGGFDVLGQQNCSVVESRQQRRTKWSREEELCCLATSRADRCFDCMLTSSSSSPQLTDTHKHTHIHTWTRCNANYPKVEANDFRKYFIVKTLPIPSGRQEVGGCCWEQTQRRIHTGYSSIMLTNRLSAVVQ